MLTSFVDRIMYIPLVLVQQGWRHFPDGSVIDAWTAIDTSHRWEYFTVGNYHIARPVKTIGEFSPLYERILTVYSHEGWGNGFAPMPGMMDVWRYWWIDRGCGICPYDLEGYGYGQMNGCDWRGPVLPPT